MCVIVEWRCRYFILVPKVSSCMSNFLLCVGSPAVLLPITMT